MTVGDRQRLFLSSTVEDLIEFRIVVLRVCQRLGIDVVAMEDFGVDPRTAAELCRTKIAGSSLFLGLYAHRYGFTPEGFAGTSITELEYQWASEQVPPPQTLVFLVDENVKWLPRWIDRGPEWQRLEDFKRRLRLRHVVGTLTTPDRLSSDLFENLPKFRDAARPPAPVAPALPRPPEPHVAHQYSLLHTADVVGRHEELAALTAWADDEAGPRVLSIVGIGGLGKSALSWRWFHDQAERGTGPAAGRLWWSFANPEAGFDRFVTTALAYCSERSIDEIGALPAADRERDLLAVLDRRPFLLVLDGVEHLLGAYTDLDFAHLRDEDVDRLATAGPTPERQRLRATADPRAGRFIRQLAGVSRSRTLLTTRLQPAALRTISGGDVPGSVQWSMPRMRVDDAAALWRELDCSGSRARMLQLFEQIDYHPLLIEVLAGTVRDFRGGPGNLDSFMRANPALDPFRLPLIHSADIFASALRGLSERATLLLSAIASFRTPIGWTTLRELFIDRLGWSTQDLDVELGSLEDRGILGWDRASNTYEVHAVMRGVVWADVVATGHDDEQSATARRTYAELMAVLQSRADYPTAAKLYSARLGNGSFPLTELGLIDTELALLEGLFPAGIDAEPAVDEPEAQGFIAWLGHAYEAAGRLPEAERCAARCLERIAGAEDVPSFLLRYLCERLRIQGRLREAHDVAERAAAAGDDLQRVLCLATIGRTDEVARALAGRRAAGLPPRRAEVQARLLIGDLDGAVEAGERFLRGPGLWVVDRLTTTIDVLDARFRSGGDDRAVERALVEVLAEARHKRIAEPALVGLRLQAEIHRAREEADRALDALDELGRHPAAEHYRLVRADAANTRALLPHASVQARADAARRAVELARCAGPPFVYRAALDTAEATLGMMGAS
jgi:hypothetical protein